MHDPTRAIASVVPATAGYGPTEAGKQASERIVVTVTDSMGTPLTGATWRWRTDERSGWVFPQTGTTVAGGRIVATWVAGAPGVGALTLTVENAVSSMTAVYATTSVASPRPPSSAVSVWIGHGSRATGYSIDMTPLAEPAGTYYAAMNWDGGYVGLQRAGSRYDRQLQFSVWDAPDGGAARVVARGDDVVCSRFGGEGSGRKCELNYPWRAGNTYRFEVTEEALNGASLLTLHVTDLATRRRRFIGTLGYAGRADLHGFAMFVEDFRRRAPTCLAQEVRSAAIRRAMARIGGAWQPISPKFQSRCFVKCLNTCN